MKKLVASALMSLALFSVTPVTASTGLSVKECFELGNTVYLLAMGAQVPVNPDYVFFLKPLGDFYTKSDAIKDPVDLQMFVVGECISNKGDLSKISLKPRNAV